MPLFVQRIPWKEQPSVWTPLGSVARDAQFLWFTPHGSSYHSLGRASIDTASTVYSGISGEPKDDLARAIKHGSSDTCKIYYPAQNIRREYAVVGTFSVNAISGSQTFFNANGNLQLRVNSGATISCLREAVALAWTTTKTITANKMHTFVLVVSESLSKTVFYVDGQLYYSGTGSTWEDFLDIGSGSTYIRLGSRANAGETMAGHVADVGFTKLPNKVFPIAQTISQNLWQLFQP